jgi:two-component system, OmpR family, KDP operon response regulator KdpE
MSEGTVLVIEDDPNLQQILSEQLRQKGWSVYAQSSGQAGIATFAQVTPDIVLLDIGLEDMDGLAVCRTLRQSSSVPIILVTAADTPQMKITALELGADDYLTKPFYLGELLARMRAVLRRTRGGGGSNPSKQLTLGTLKIDLSKREVQRDEESVSLTKTEFDILQVLVQNLDQVLSYQELLKQVWGDGYDDVRALHVHVSNLRRKLEPKITGTRYLITIPGTGYRLRSQD